MHLRDSACCYSCSFVLKKQPTTSSVALGTTETYREKMAPVCPEDTAGA